MIYFKFTKMIGTGPNRIFIIRRKLTLEFQWGPIPPQRIGKKESKDSMKYWLVLFSTFSLEETRVSRGYGPISAPSHTSWDGWASTRIQGSRLPAPRSFHHSMWLSQGLLSKFIKGMDSQSNRCRNVRGSFTCHIELMNIFLQVCETEEFIQYSFIQQVCTEWLWWSWHCSKHWGPSRELTRPLEICLSRHRRLLLDLGRRRWERPGVDLAPGKTRGVQM